jgi:response regulator RpfG family c-di-GMP phosphodiesterase
MSEAPLPRVLCVDDEPNVLAAMERNLFGSFEVVVADGGEAGLEAIRRGEPFSVVMSDMRMPGMDGAAFLAKARELAPDSVRILLTGQADVQSSIAAVNQGGIFRYLCKPCPKEQLLATLGEAVNQYRLVRAEKELLETTLTAAVNTLAEVLAMVAPWAFQRAAFAQACVRHALPKLEWPDAWQYSVAAALCQIGCVSIPADVMQNDASQRTLTPKERELLHAHSEVAERLIGAIPRLQTVARIVRYQAGDAPPDAPIEVVRGAHLLHAALELERHSSRDRKLERPWELLRDQTPPIPDYIIKALSGFRANVSQTRTVRVRDLMPGWVVDEDVRCSNGMMVLAKGHELTDTAIAALNRLLEASAIVDPIRVRCGAG